MLRRTLLFVGLALAFSQAAFSQDQPRSSPEAKQIEALVNKAAALVDAREREPSPNFASVEASGGRVMSTYSPIHTTAP